MEIAAIVAGTGFEGRAARIKTYARPGMAVILEREPDNPHDSNAIAVYLHIRKWYTLFRNVPIHIGYIKRSRARAMVKRLDQGGKILSAKINSMYTERDHPRVSLKIKTDW